MTGYQSKKAAASAKTIDEVNWADHEPDGRGAAAQDNLAQPEQDGQCKRCTDGCAACDARKLPKQEPVACKHEWFRTGAMEPRECRCIKCGAWNTTPPQRKPLSDEEIGAILEDINAFGTRLYTFARAIEAAHGIKENT